MPRREHTAARPSAVALHVGASVAVSDGLIDPDLGTPIWGWQGRIVRLEADRKYRQLVHIRWDSLTLRGMDGSVIVQSEQRDLDWSQMVLAIHEVRPTAARDTPREVAQAVKELSARYAWIGLGAEGERIQKVLMGVDPDDMLKCMRVWNRYLSLHLKLPFDAEVSEIQERGPLGWRPCGGHGHLGFG